MGEYEVYMQFQQLEEQTKHSPVRATTTRLFQHVLTNYSTPPPKLSFVVSERVFATDVSRALNLAPFSHSQHVAGTGIPVIFVGLQSRL